MQTQKQAIVAAAVVVAELFGVRTSHAVLVSPEIYCSISKMRAATAAFACFLNQDVRLAGGLSSDPTTCASKLSDRFASLESDGNCATTGDADLASSRAEAAAVEVADTLGALPTLTAVELACVKRKAKLAARFARCDATALALRLNGGYRRLRPDFQLCAQDFETDAVVLEGLYECPNTGEAQTVEEQAAAGYGFLPNTRWLSTELGELPLPHGYLVNANFYNHRLVGAHLRGADLTGARLDNSYLTSADLRDVTFDGVYLFGINADGAQMEGAELASAHLENVTASGLVQCPASLPAGWYCVTRHLLGPTAISRFQDFNGVDLSGLDLSYADLTQSTFQSAILHDVDLSAANLFGASFTGADLAGADLGDAEMANVNGSTLVACPAVLPTGFLCVNRNIVGYGMVVTGANLAGADLHGVDMDYTRFTDTDLSGVNLGGAGLGQVDWVNTICPDGTNSDADGQTCCGHHVGSPPAFCGLYH